MSRAHALFPSLVCSRGQSFYHRNLFQRFIPACFTGDEYVSIRPEGNFAVQTARRNHQQLAVHLHVRKCRPTDRAEAFSMSRRWQIEYGDLALSRDPFQLSRRREQICGVSRTGIFAAILTVAEIKLLKVSFDFEADCSTQART